MLFILLFLQEPTLVKQQVQAYFSCFSERQDFEKLMGFYDEKATLHDMVYGKACGNKSEIRAFYNWNQGALEKGNDPRTLVITNQFFDGHSVITEGYFTRFSFNGLELGPWHFLMIHEFNDRGLIIRQVDWLNYWPKFLHEGGQNLNQNLPGFVPQK